MAILHYLDFELTLSRQGDQYLGEVRNSPAGSTARVPLAWPFTTQPLDMLMLKLENAILKGRGFRNGPITSEERVLREFGSDIFTALFRNSPEIAATFSASLKMVQSQQPPGGLRLVFRIEAPELAMLPWEYMFDQATVNEDGKFVCLRSVSALVRFVPGRGGQTVPQPGKPLRILGMIANPAMGDWLALNTEAERTRIEQALRPRIEPTAQPAEEAISLQWVPGGTRDDLFEQLQRESWDVLHFIGHGGTQFYTDEQGKPRSQGYLVLQDGRGGADLLFAEELRLALEDSTSLKLAFLNCCDSARSGSNFSSFGADVVNSGVPLALAMQFSITDGAAARFAGQFYKSLTGGQTVEQALTTARKFVRFQSNLEWGIPVLYTRTGSCVLFEVRPAEDAGNGTPAPQPAPAASVARSAQNRAQAREALRRLFT